MKKFIIEHYLMIIIISTIAIFTIININRGEKSTKNNQQTNQVELKIKILQKEILEEINIEKGEKESIIIY